MTSILKVTEIQDPTNSNSAITVDSSGNIALPNISSNALYRTGTWTVTDVSGNGLSLTQSETARYIRIGDLVYVNFYVTFPGSGGNSSNSKLGGLPFPTATGYGYHYLAGRIQDYSAADVRVQLQHGESWGYPMQNNSFLTNAQLAVGRYVLMSGCYIAQSGT